MNIAPRKLLEDMFDAAVKAAQPERCIPLFSPGHLKAEPSLLEQEKLRPKWRGYWRPTGRAHSKALSSRDTGMLFRASV